MAAKKRAAGRIIAGVALLAYSAWMLWLLFGQRLGTGIYEQQAAGINLTPFSTLRLYCQLLQSDSGYLVRHAFANLTGNVVLFIPLGILLPAVFYQLRHFLKTFLLAAVLIATVEAVQYFTQLGACDVDDLILNLLGVALGYSLYRYRRR